MIYKVHIETKHSNIDFQCAGCMETLFEYGFCDIFYQGSGIESSGIFIPKEDVCKIYIQQLGGDVTMPIREIPVIKKVIFNKPYTIVLWKDGTKTICKATKGTAFREEAGLSICFMKKVMGLTNTQFGKLVNKYKEDER